MFLLQMLAWVVLSAFLVALHLYMSPRRHPRQAMTMLTGVLWGLTGGMLGTVIRLRDFETGYSVLALVLAGVTTLVFLGLEWASAHQHPVHHS